MFFKITEYWADGGPWRTDAAPVEEPGESTVDVWYGPTGDCGEVFWFVLVTPEGATHLS